jgi:hypothetical protein
MHRLRGFGFLVPTLASALALSLLSARAIDINPSRDNEPDKSNNSTSGNRFSIFAGDPNRIQKANTIDFKDFTAKVELNTTGVSLAATRNDPSSANNVRMTFTIKNAGKRTYTLSFPSSQRYDVVIKNPAHQMVYKWSLDKKFTDDVGAVIINPTDRIGYVETISFNTLYAPLETGVYTIEFSLANYPEIAATGLFTVTP